MIAPQALFCAQCGVRFGSIPSAPGVHDDAPLTFVSRLGVRFFHGNGLLVRFIRFLVRVALSALVLFYLVRLILALGGGKGWWAVLMLASMGYIGASMEVRELDPPARKVVIWIGRIIMGIVLFAVLMSATENTPMRLK